MSSVPAARDPAPNAILGAATAVLAPVALTAVLVPLGVGQSRDYVFLYVALVAALGVTLGLRPALLAAAASFLLVDFFFVPPVHTLTIADRTDVVNLLVFFGAAGLVGGLGSRRRSAEREAQALAENLGAANRELAQRNREQAEAAGMAVRLARAQQQVQVLEETDHIRRDFLANVSHELRTPLGSVLTGSTGLAARPDLPGDARDQLQAIAAEGRRLGRLVDDMLDMAQIEGNALELRLDSVDLGHAVEAAVDRLQRASPRREVSWHAPAAEVDVVADWDRLGQVLDNILANADHYSPPGTPIAVTAAPGARGMAVVQVTDAGPGVPHDARERIFERFVRGGDHDVPGTGLGLAIVKGLVEAQGGRVWVEDNPDGPGARFGVALPAAAAPATG
ncbi:MAG TPA: ATP-binding protein [Candidatus Angelobacter sp.]|jgi:K+-sensing histidine kinase KdpD|nr:ATP-binding protein [Candidatus Angelobacter sp.]